MERISRFQPVLALDGHRLAVRAESAVAQSGSVGLGDPSTSAAAASRVDAGLSGGTVGLALLALSPPRVLPRAVFFRNSCVPLHFLHSVLAGDVWSAALLARARERPFNRHDERGDDCA